MRKEENSCSHYVGASGIVDDFCNSVWQREIPALDGKLKIQGTAKRRQNIECRI